MVDLFLQGGIFMWPILILWVFGIGYSIERFWTLTRASVNTRKFMAKLLSALQSGGIQAATAECEQTSGPVASVLHAGLTRAHKGIGSVEKAITNAGSIEMAFLERGMLFLSTVIVMAPLLGFSGTVSGMISAFNSIKRANDISPAIVAGGIAEALLTTIFGLIVAMSIQICYNWFQSRIDKLIIDMEESSIAFLDALESLQEEKSNR